MKSMTLVNMHFGELKNYFPLFLNNDISAKRLLRSNNPKIYWEKIFKRISEKLKRSFRVMFR